MRDAFDDILRFWFDRGVAGFRIDVCHSIIKDRQLRDNPAATADDHWWVQLMGQRSVYNACRPEVHDVLRRWRELAESYDPHRVLIGETYVLEPEQLGSFYGAGDELNLAFNFMLIHSKFRAAELRAAVEHAEQHLPAHAWPVWTGGNHDNHRFPTRWGEDHPDRARAALLMLMGLRGTPFLYYGDEIGMPDTDVPVDRVLDPVGVFHGPRMGRDPERTPMAWTARAGRGLLGARRRAVAPVRRRRRVQRGRPAARSRLDVVVDARPHRPAERAARAAPRLVHDAAQLRRPDLGVAARRADRRRGEHLRRAGRRARRRPGRDPHLDDPRRATTSV